MSGQHIAWTIILGVVMIYVGIGVRGIGDAKGWTNTW